jgi:hypothetical protein
VCTHLCIALGIAKHGINLVEQLQRHHLTHGPVLFHQGAV